jgi:hypothetical protein
MTKHSVNIVLYSDWMNNYKILKEEERLTIKCKTTPHKANNELSESASLFR